ncbi:hypothetical protein BMJ35_13950 [Sinorhizobium medicae]|uniref:hypothetical protein n=1 Tax=Sinorhizobium medicae TaxID=110321 RepID=UPI0011AF3EEE|nr:hypothetical protein [Sinorhizobium medicae]MDX0801658.1 hypothetical protein [Sinorhizobium medicae]MDX1188081.1 hypothetical protein [Sinorhizobium medicae]MDX1230635.1 hypothetical protein [Sinorhizobium medicae]PLT89645.1 hypothetical protein BMJ35_13950 [Sinorhizobium medicae]
MTRYEMKRFDVASASTAELIRLVAEIEALNGASLSGPIEETLLVAAMAELDARLQPKKHSGSVG